MRYGYGEMEKMERVGMGLLVEACAARLAGKIVQGDMNGRWLMYKDQMC